MNELLTGGQLRAFAENNEFDVGQGVQHTPSRGEESLCLPTQEARAEADDRCVSADAQAAADEAGIAFTTNQVGAMFGFFFSAEKNISRFAQVAKCNMEQFRTFYHGMLNEGVYLAPSAYEAGFVSSAHTDADIDATIEAARRVMKTL